MSWSTIIKSLNDGLLSETLIGLSSRRSILSKYDTAHQSPCVEWSMVVAAWRFKDASLQLGRYFGTNPAGHCQKDDHDEESHFPTAQSEVFECPSHGSDLCPTASQWRSPESLKRTFRKEYWNNSPWLERWSRYIFTKTTFSLQWKIKHGQLSVMLLSRAVSTRM